MEQHNSVFRLNGKKFDLIFGSALLLGSPFLIDSDFIAKHLLFAGIFGLTIYMLEAWAFYFKVTTVRIRALEKMSGDNWTYNGKQLPSIPWVMRVGRFMRMCIRVYVLVQSVHALTAYFGPGNAFWTAASDYAFIGGILIEAQLMRTTRVQNNKRKDADYLKETEREQEWRSKHARFMQQKHHGILELASDIVLLVLAMLFAHSYWNYSASFFYERIEQAHIDHAPVGGLLWTMLVVVTFTSILVVVPARLAYWLEEIYAAGDVHAKRKVRWSVVFACAAFVLPVFFYFVKVWYID